jgi:dehydrogenase/reductase SDR family protein 7B
MTDRKVVIITGASSGIGKASALVFAKKGFAVVINARSSEKLKLVEQELRQVHADVVAVVGDVSVEDECKFLIDQAIQRFGRIDVLINNAGMSMRALFNGIDLTVLKKLMDINFWGAVYCTYYALPHLIKSKGSVVGVSSIAGKKGLPGRTGYSSSKFALEGFLETIRTENLKNGLHVLVACPGFTATEIRSHAFNASGVAQGETPLDESKLMTSDQVAARILYAVEHRKRDLILTATGKLTVWLDKFFPSKMDTVVYNHMAKEPDSPFK